MRSLSIVVGLGLLLQGSSDHRVGTQSELHAQAGTEGDVYSHTREGIPSRRRLQEEEHSNTKWSCPLCGPPFGPPSGDINPYFPPYPWKGVGTIAQGSVDFDCDSLEDADESAACTSLVSEYTNPSIEWFQSTDDRSHTLASVVSSVGYPMALQFSVGSASNVTLTVDYSKYAAKDAWIKVNNAASVMGFAILGFVEFEDKNGDYIFNDGDAVVARYNFDGAWSAPTANETLYKEGNEETMEYGVGHATADGKFVIDYRTSEYEVVVNDNTLNAERVKADISITHTRTQAGTLLAIDIVTATSRFENGEPSSTMAQFVNAEDGFVDWSSLATMTNDPQSDFVRVVTGEFQEMDVSELGASAFQGLLASWGTVELKKTYVSFVPDASFTVGTQKCDGLEQDPDEGINARACEMNCAADPECQVFSFEYETGCFLGQDASSCSNNGAYESGVRNAINNNDDSAITFYWDPAVTYEEGGFTPGEDGIDLDYELAVVGVMLAIIGFLSYIFWIVVRWWLKREAEKHGDFGTEEKYGDHLAPPNAGYGATQDKAQI